MGGKSRKTGGVSRALINRILKKQGKSSCGSKKGGSKKGSKNDVKDKPSRGLLDSVEED